MGRKETEHSIPVKKVMGVGWRVRRMSIPLPYGSTELHHRMCLSTVRQVSGFSSMEADKMQAFTLHSASHHERRNPFLSAPAVLGQRRRPYKYSKTTYEPEDSGLSIY
jgi:hypothetical protein